MNGRRFTLYFAWDRPAEVSAGLGVLDNRYPTLFELRRAIWPHYEHAGPPDHDQGIVGFLDDVVLFDFKTFLSAVEEVTGEPVRLIERRTDDGSHRLLNVLDETDTLIVISLDHFQTNQWPDEDEVAAVKHFLTRERSCLAVCPHHDIGRGDSIVSRRIELEHHGDKLVPPQQRIGQFAKELLACLGLPVEHCFGLSPAEDLEHGGPAPLQVFEAQDERKVLEGVKTFNLHPHLPHLDIRPEALSSLRVLAKQNISSRALPHPFVDAGNTSFNAFLWAPPKSDRLGDVFVCDATLWSAAFGGLASLSRLWKNLAQL